MPSYNIEVSAYKKDEPKKVLPTVIYDCQSDGDAIRAYIEKYKLNESRYLGEVFLPHDNMMAEPYRLVVSETMDCADEWA